MFVLVYVDAEGYGSMTMAVHPGSKEDAGHWNLQMWMVEQEVDEVDLLADTHTIPLLSSR